MPQVNKLLIMIPIVLLSGCASLFETKIKLRTETVEVYKPILYCPAPDWTELKQDTLAIDLINSNTSDGEVAKRYKATIIQLRSRNTLLLKSLQKYDKTNEAYNALEKNFKEQLDKGDFTINKGNKTPEL